MPTCVIKGCRNRPELVQQKKSLALTFHRFPILNLDLMKRWMKSIGNGNLQNPNTPITKTSVICSEHFDAKLFKHSGMRTRLVATAVPTIFKAAKVIQKPHVLSMTNVSSSSQIVEMDLDTGLAAIEDINRITNLKIPSLESPSKKIVDVPSIPLLHEKNKRPVKILPAEPEKKTFVFLRNMTESSKLEHPQIPAQEMSPISKILTSKSSSSMVPSIPFQMKCPSDDNQGVVCVVGLNPDGEPDVKLFDTAGVEGLRKFENLCRVCLNTTGNMYQIFAGNSGLADKIHKHLSIIVTINDRLPLKLCSECVDSLNQIEELSARSYENELRLKVMLDVDATSNFMKAIKKAPEAPTIKHASQNVAKEETRTFCCPDCQKTSTSFKSFVRHCYTLHKRKKCKWCDVLLVSQEEMRQHRIEAHGSTCASCGAKFQGINSMLRHIRQEHPDFKSNTCEICGKSFISKYSLGVHYEIHNSNKPYLCETCGKNLKSRQKLKHHKCNPEEEELIRSSNECTLCGKKYTFRSSLRRHMLRHTNNKRFQCHICCKRFYGSVNLKNHMVVHERSTVFECQMCCARYYHKRNMVTHLKEKHSTRWHYKCPYCVLLFASIDEVVRHRDEQHKCHEEVKKRNLVEIEQEPGVFEEYRCKICERQFENIYALTHHFVEHVIHGPEDLNIKTIGVDGLLECALCGANLTSTWAMRCHIKKVHLNLQQRELVHTCDHCTKQFATKSQLRRHIMQHTGEKPFHCSTCDAGFRSRTAHKIHMRIHTGETPFHCQKCPKKFRSSAILRNHEGVHMRPFACNQCLQRFSSKSALKSHMDLHEREPASSLKCQFCDFVSKNRSALKKHEVLSHVDMDTLETLGPENEVLLVTDEQQEHQALVQADFGTTVEATYFAL